MTIIQGCCRCCGAMAPCRILNEKYDNKGRTEFYSEMIKNCFGIELSHLTSKATDRLVCTHCIDKVRQSLIFKIQVMRCEQAFLLQKMCASKLETKDIPMLQRSRRYFKTDWRDLEESNFDIDLMPDGLDDEIDLDQLSEYESLKEYNDEELLRTFEEKHTDKQFPDCVQSVNKVDNRCEYSSDDDLHIANVDTYKHRKGRSKLPLSVISNKKVLKTDVIMACTDPFMQASNIASIVKYSYACPFKNRFNHIMCYYCGQYFLDPLLLREHSMTHDPKKDFKPTRYRYTKLDLTRIDCRLCPQKIDDLEVFKRHLVTQHKKNYFKEIKDCILPFKLVENVHKCILCDEEFSYFYGLYKHMNQHFSNFMCETCGIGFVDEISLQKHTPSHDSKCYPCSTCDNTFKSEYTLTSHIRRIHKKEVPGSFCTQCDLYLPLSEKAKHMVEAHGEPPTVPCLGCDQVFSSRRLLTLHVRRVHMNDYRYKCDICERRFFRRSSLTSHLPRHSGARDHACTVCRKRYPRRKTLIDHMKIHNNVRRYRVPYPKGKMGPYITKTPLSVLCHICGQAFVQNCSLKGHMKSKHPEYG